MHKWILLAHIAGGATWFGSHVYLESLMAGAARSGDPTAMMTVAQKASDTNRRVMTIAAIITVVFGIWLVFDTSYKFEDLWVTIGFGAALAGVAVGFFLLTPRERELSELVEEHGLTSDEALEAVKRLANLGHVQSLLVTIAFVVMVLKPTL